MIALGWVTNIFQRGAASMGRLNYILTAKPQIDDRAAKISPETRVEGTIEFRNLNFTYPTADMNLGKNGANGHGREAKAVIKNIDLTIPAGSTVAIIGPTGSGKTTLAALIARLWDAPEGTMLIDGRPDGEGPGGTFPRAIGYVSQDTYFLTVRGRANNPVWFGRIA